MKALVDYVHKIIVIESILIQFDALYCARGTDNVKSPLADERGTNGPFRPIHTRTLTHTHSTEFYSAMAFSGGWGGEIFIWLMHR